MRRTSLIAGIGRSLRYTLAVLALLGAGAATLFLQHQSAVKRYEAAAAQATAEGFDLRRESYRPKRVPEAENFLAAPVFTEWLVDKETWDAAVEGLKLEPLPDHAEAAKKRGDDTRAPSYKWHKETRPFSEAWDAYLGTPLAERLAKHQAVLDGIAEAAQQRPGFDPAPYPAFQSIPSWEISLPYTFLLPTQKLIKLRALSALEKPAPPGENASSPEGRAAMADLFTALRLSRLANAEKTFMGILVRSVLCDTLQQVIATGLNSGHWSSDGIATLQSELEGIHPLEEAQEHFAGELAFILQDAPNSLDPQHDPLGIKAEFGIYPLPWLHNAMLRKCLLLDLRTATFSANNKAHYLAAMTSKQGFPACMDAKPAQAQARVYREVVTLQKQQLMAEEERSTAHNIMSLTAQGHLYGVLVRAASFQTWRDQAVVACALERFRLQHGSYPEALSALVPEFCTELPHDVITGEPLRYRAAEGAYTLYSVGWNGTDDGGKVAFKENGGLLHDEGDWVWLQPPN